MSELTAKDFHYCVTPKCPHKVAKTSHLMDACPLCQSTEYTDAERKRLIDKGVASAQSPNQSKSEPKGEDSKAGTV